MKIDEYIWVMCDAIREDGDVSLFFVLDEMINYLSGCKLNFRKLSVEERKWLKKIAEKSDLLKNPKPQRGRR